MSISPGWLCILTIAVLLQGTPLGAWTGDEGKPAGKTAGDRAGSPPEPPEETEKLSTTRHEVVIGGEPVAYTATAGRMPLRDDKGKLRANVFFVAYTREGVPDVATRPLTFAFNGGPGSSSVWLHLGVLGPRRVKLDEEGDPGSPPYELEDNEHSLLDITDIVMVDPVSTGFSRAAEGQDPKQFHGYREDIESVGDFIATYVRRNDRWGSPKFVLGESYGTTRAAGLAGHLQDRHGMFLNGISMVSSVLNFQTIRFATGNDLPYILFLPSYCATAWYHRRLADDLQEDLGRTLGEVEHFARREYTVALMKGDSLAGPERQRVVEKLARYTGLSPEFIERTDLRIRMSHFAKELLRDEGRTVGRLDSRFKGIDRSGVTDRYEYDPSMVVIQGAFTACLNRYVRGELEFDLDRNYEISGPVHPWSYDDFENRYLDTAETLRQAMTKNPHLRVFVASGYYDLATPHFASDYTYGHLGLDPALRKNVKFGYYEAGHMMYIHGPSLARFKRDHVKFYRWATSPSPDAP